MRVLFYHVLPGDARPSAPRVGHVIGGLRRLGVEHHVLARASALVTNAPALAAELERKCPSKKAAVAL